MHTCAIPSPYVCSDPITLLLRETTVKVMGITFNIIFYKMIAFFFLHSLCDSSCLLTLMRSADELPCGEAHVARNRGQILANSQPVRHGTPLSNSPWDTESCQRPHELEADPPHLSIRMRLQLQPTLWCMLSQRTQTSGTQLNVVWRHYVLGTICLEAINNSYTHCVPGAVLGSRTLQRIKHAHALM